MGKPTVFISYSHKDEVWKNLLRPHLGMLEQLGHLDIWDDRAIDGGAQWYDEIRTAMSRARVAICLVSPDFLASSFCLKEEIPYLLERSQSDGLELLPILLRPCLWKIHEWLRNTQMIPRDGKSVSEDFPDREDGVFLQVAERIYQILGEPAPIVADPPAVAAEEVFAPIRGGADLVFTPPDLLDITRLPVTGSDLFGRRDELELLDDAWASETTNVVSLVAWGGVGKSTLVNKWLERLAAENYRGARRVYGWSFYSQGTNDRVTSADQFIDAALRVFGDPDPTAGSPWDKGERLAELVRKEKTLLLLDGMEPLQSSHEFERGKVKDPALATLLIELARRNNGLCVVTTRESVSDLNRYSQTTRTLDLEQITPEAGRALLRVGGVQGTDAELEKASGDFGNHALALNLLAAYLRDVPGHHISHVAAIPDLPDLSVEQGKHPRRVLTAFERRFGEGPEVEALRLLGLFDRPASAGEIAALRESPDIAGLTGGIRALDEAGWLRLLAKLRRLGLIATASHHDPDELDAHPIIREHFGQRLRETGPTAWQEGNNRLYEYLKRTAKEFPDTLEEMAPLLAAITHGCRANCHQESLQEVFIARALRSQEFFLTKKLGTIAASLAALHNYFESPWRQPVRGLADAYQGFVLGQAGHYLRMLGQLNEAIQPMQAALEVAIQQEDWTNAAIRAGNLSEVTQSIGDLRQSLAYGRQAVDLADRNDASGQRMIKRTTLAAILHVSGRKPEAEALFREAEAMQKKIDSHSPYLYSLRGYQFCDLLLDSGEFEGVQRRAEQTLGWQEPKGILLDIAIHHLSLGRAQVHQARHQGLNDFVKAVDHVEQAVTGVRNAGTQDYVPLALLARAELHLLRDDLDRAQRDIDEAMTIAERGGMRLHQADAHLAYARLHLTRSEQDEARRSLDTARATIERMGYHRRDGDCHLIEARLRLARGEKAEARQSVDAVKALIEEQGYHIWDVDVAELEAMLGDGPA